MLAYYFTDLTERLPKRDEVGGWRSVFCHLVSALIDSDTSLQELEATLHCTMSIQEAVPLEAN